jgi:hypothetical protein
MPPQRNGAGKDSIIQTPFGRVDLGLPITARAVNFGLEAERRYLAKRCEGQPMQFAAAFRICHAQAPMLGPDPCPRGSSNGFHVACRINFLPAVPARMRSLLHSGWVIPLISSPYTIDTGCAGQTQVN